MPLVRVAKVSLVGAVALYLLVVVFNNLTDYGSNYAFVARVLSMDTTFEGNTARWRAMTSPVFHHATYAVIMLWEASAAALCAFGAWRLWRHRGRSAAEFNHAKGLAIAGLTWSLLQWFVAFLTVGGEWFLMWQSRIWNGQDAAFRMFGCIGIILLFVAMDDRDAPATGTGRTASDA